MPSSAAACAKATCLAGLVALAALPAPPPASAQPLTPPPEAGPIELEADSAELLHDERTVTYSGNVIITQTHNRLKGDHATLRYTEQNTVERAEITGEPATWKRQAPDQEAHQGSALSIEYLVEQNRILLTGDAEIETDSVSLRGGRIEYDSITGNARLLPAGGETGSEKGRIQVILKDQADESDPR